MSVARPLRDWRDLRVLSLEQAAALPFATCHLADLGAEVIRVQAPASVPRGLVEPSLLRGKRLVGLDLAKPGGAQAFRDLAAGCDVVAHNFTPRVMRKYGIDFEAIRAVQPAVIYCALTGYGSTGPWAERPLFGPGAEALSGHNLLIGDVAGRDAGDAPGRPGTVTYADYLCGMNLLVALLATLVERFAGGERCARFIDISLYETAVSQLSSTIAARQLGRAKPRRVGNADAGYALHGVFACAGHDRYLAIAADADQAATVARELGLEASASVAGVDAAIALCERDALAARLAAIGVPCAVVRDAADMYAEHRLRGDSPFGACVVGGEQLVVPGPAWGGGPNASACVAESLGECHVDVLARVAGYDAPRTAELVASGALVERPIRYGVAAGDPQAECARGFVSRVDAVPEPKHARPAPAERAANADETRRPRWPLRVTEVGNDPATAWAGRLLAAQGCEVVAVPGGSPGFRGAVSRWGDAAGAAQLAFDANKIVIELTGSGVPAGLASSDVVLWGADAPGFTPPPVGSLHLHSVATAAETSTVGVSADLLLHAAAGFLFITGEAHELPQQLPPHAAAMLAGTALAAAALVGSVSPAAVPRRIVQADALATFAHVGVSRYAATGEVSRREGVVKHALRIARAADRFVYCAAGAVLNFDTAAFAALLEEPRLAAPIFATAEGRLARWAEYRELVEARLRRHTAAEWIARAAAAHLTFAHVQTIADLLACPQLRARRSFATLAWFGKQVQVPRAPARIDGVAAEQRPPRFMTASEFAWLSR